MNRPLAFVTSLFVSLLLASATVNAAGAQINVSDSCSLAQAIQSANQNQAVGGCQAGVDRDQIHLDRDVSTTGTLPTITSIMIIDGNGHTIRGNGSHRLFEVTAGSLALIDMTLANGFANGNGGAILVNGGNLILRNSRISNSNAANGGAISVDNGAINIGHGSSLEYNRAHRGGAIWVGRNGRLLSDAGLSIMNSSASGTGGGIYNTGTVHIIGPGAIERNTASGRGGGIFSRGGTVILEDSRLRIANNSAAGGGGISLIEGAELSAYFGLYVGYNRGTNGGGGGIGVDASRFQLRHATVEGNHAPMGGGIWGRSATIAVESTTFRDNRSRGNGYDICAENSTLTVDGANPAGRPGMTC